MPDLREYAERNGNGLPRFHVGLIFSINGQLVEVIRVVSTFANPARVLVEVEPCGDERTKKVYRGRQDDSLG